MAKAMTAREQAHIIAGAIHELVLCADPGDRRHNYPESAVNAAMTSLTKSIEGCRADAADARDQALLIIRRKEVTT